LGLTFFGLTPNYRKNLFRQVHEIVFHGNGGYSYEDVYLMPIWLRNYTFQLINEHYEKQAEEAEKSSGKQQLTNNKKFGPDVKNPSYTTKARK
jgi:hypothetical protein